MAPSLRLGGHPVHPMLVHFPVALWTGGAIADIGGWLSAEPLWWPISFGSQALGVVSAAVAMLVGFFDYAALPKEHPAQDSAVYHMLAMCTAWLLFVISLALRGLPPSTTPPIWATAAALAGFAVMAVGGWLGGQLVYRFGVGVQAHEPPRADSAPERKA